MLQLFHLEECVCGTEEIFCTLPICNVHNVAIRENNVFETALSSIGRPSHSGNLLFHFPTITGKDPHTQEET
jgi:hypothetical protein